MGIRQGYITWTYHSDVDLVHLAASHHLQKKGGTSGVNYTRVWG